ncbi:MAG: hypothetical protein O7C75_15910 [Verrucomicrobia bacterium]|nr:hypothetical protein [Verrucomicrobiota bacterium]
MANTTLLGESIRVVGSNFAGAALKLNAESSSIAGSYDVEYLMSGSVLGLIKLKEDFADVAFVLQTSDNHPSLEGLTSIPLGFWGIYFAVADGNPSSEVRMTDLFEILRKTRDGLKSEWGPLLPGEPKWTNRLIFVTFDLKESDPSYSIFLDRFFDKVNPDNFSSMGEKIENPYLSGVSNLLVMSRLPKTGSGLRVLSLIQEGQSVGFPPSPESMFFADYPLHTRLLLVVRDPKDTKVRAFVRDFFEKNRLELLLQAGLVSAPENVQKQTLLEFDLDF